MMNPTSSEYGIHARNSAPHARLFLSQKDLIRYCQECSPCNPMIAEVNDVWYGNMSSFLLQTFQPQTLYLMDTFHQNDTITKLFTPETHFGVIQSKFEAEARVKVVKGVAIYILSSLPNDSLDYISLTPPTSYQHARRLVNIAQAKLKHNGILQIHKYCSDVQTVVNEWIERDDGVRVIGLSLDRSGYQDIAMQVHKPTIPSFIKVQLDILTPCSRPENLEKMMQTIQFHLIRTWYVIYDTRRFPFKKRFNHPQIVEMECKSEGTVGHQIRNMGLELICDGLLYFLDDDNVVHPSFWNVAETFQENKIYTFDLIHQDGTILTGDRPVVKCIDTAQYVFDIRLVENLRFDASLYTADGVFIQTLCETHRDKWEYVRKIGCFYNRLKW